MATPVSLLIWRAAFDLAGTTETKSLRRWRKCHDILNDYVFPLLDKGVTVTPSGDGELSKILALVPDVTRKETPEGIRWERTPDPALSERLAWWYNCGEEPTGNTLYTTLYGEEVE